MHRPLQARRARARACPCSRSFSNRHLRRRDGAAAGRRTLAGSDRGHGRGPGRRRAAEETTKGAGKDEPLRRKFCAEVMSDIRNGNKFMAHNCGFTGPVLHATLLGCGFKSVVCVSKGDHYALWSIAFKNKDVDQDYCLNELKKHVKLTVS